MIIRFYTPCQNTIRYMSYCMVALLLIGCEQYDKPSQSQEVAINGINGGDLSENGQYALVGSVIHGGSLWRTRDHERLYNWNHSSEADDRIIISANISDDNNRALTADASTMVLWDMKTGNALRFWTSPAEVLASQLSTDGRFALLGLADHSAVIFDAVKGGIARTLTHKGRVRSVDLSENNLIAITGSEDHTAVIWQVGNSSPLMTIQHDDDVQLVKLSPDGRYALTAAKYDRVEIWDIEKQASIGTLPLRKEQLKRGLRVTAAEFSDDGKQLLLGYPNRTVELRNTRTMAVIHQWQLPKRKRWQPSSAAVIDVAFDRQDKQFWALSSDGFIHQLSNRPKP